MVGSRPILASTTAPAPLCGPIRLTRRQPASRSGSSIGRMRTVPAPIIVCKRGILVVAGPYPADVPRDEPSWLPAACAGCGQRWYGIDRAHCGTCHRTFTEVDFFDRHRVDEGCRS